MMIREATAADWDAIWPFFHEIAAAGETFVYPLDLDKDQGREWWMITKAPGRSVVAVDDEHGVVGTAHMNTNRPGNGSHMGTASFMVDPAHAGRGIGRALCEYVIEWARGAGYRGIVFNAVVETNTAAVELYRKLGFSVLGTVPEGFKHPDKGYVGLHMMHLPLTVG
ncbi:N-acetyltransferase family protein [Streptomyces boninensis]|uniref:GNAT family N-acetyltransferase n=1 Tax=Streptomyces boninensis TaxID=2039455 RepID=UPI003B21D259